MWLGVLCALLPAPKAIVAYCPSQVGPKALDLAAAKAVSKAGYEVQLLSAGAIESIPGGTRLLVLTDSQNMPARLAGPVDRFLKSRGRLLALRTPAWRDPLYLQVGKWVTAAEYGYRQAQCLPEHGFFELREGSLQGWSHSSNEPASRSSYGVESCGLVGGSMAIHATIDSLTGWDTSCSPSLRQPFGSGQTITQFAAKGGPRTSQMVVEWREKDGSRWIAAIPLSTAWRLYRLAPEAFKYWPSNSNRGFGGDKFNPANADSFSLGMAFSHNDAVGGKHEFWLANLGASTSIADEPSDAMGLAMPPTDGLYPHYKFFKTTVPVSAVDPLSGKALAKLKETFSVQPRPEPTGFDKRRQWTFEALLEARDKTNQWRGIPAALIRWNAGERAGAGLASFAITDDAFYTSPSGLASISKAAKRLNEKVWLVDAGTDRYTQFAGQKVTVGATVYSEIDAKGTLSFGRTVAGKRTSIGQKTVELKAGRTCSVRYGDIAAAACSIQTQLAVNGKVVESCEQPLNAYSPPATKSFVTKKPGAFLLGGKRIRFNGVNYMPSSGIGTEDGEYFEYWIDRQAYDPKIINRDLKKIKELGLNAISVFIYDRSVEAGNLVDLLRQCRELGLKVNLSLRPGTPLDFNWQGVKKIIEAFRLKNEDTVFAYDLAWEPNLGNHDARKRFDSEWQKWIVAKYGSVESADRQWGIVTRPVSNPSDMQLVTDGPWRLFVADYRRFVNELLLAYYDNANRQVKSIDPNHFVSFRMSEAGNPTFNWDGVMPYELSGIAWATDFLAPEAYGRIGNWEQVKPGLFEVAYCKSLSPGNPVIWAEAGVSCLDSARLTKDADLERKQGELLKNLYKMMIQSESDGVFWWWYPGGARIGENSDFGIVNPDGTDRPSTAAIRKYGPQFLALKDADKPLKILYYKRDETSRGMFGIYEKLKADFWIYHNLGYRVMIKDQEDEYTKDPNTSPNGIRRMLEILGWIEPVSPVPTPSGML